MFEILKIFQVCKQQQILIKVISDLEFPNVRQTLVVTFDGRKFTSVQNVIKNDDFYLI